MNSKNLLVLLILYITIELRVLGLYTKDHALARPLNKIQIKKINQAPKNSWKADTSKFQDWSSNTIQRLMGVPIEKLHETKSSLLQIQHNLQGIKIPIEFDARKKWPDCPTIREIRDQGCCGSCWAVSAVEAMSDRICIHSKSKYKYHLSADDLLSCCKECGYGCEGGDPIEAWEYFAENGICTGGNYKSHQGCKPYSIQWHQYFKNGTKKKCDEDDISTPICTEKCQKGYNLTYKKDKKYGKNYYKISADAKQIQMEILKNGPVQAAFLVYEDFLNYKSGVYVYQYGNPVGGHAVKIIGWGIDKETTAPYWLVANSWNTDWAEKGFFRILRGFDECEFESYVVAGIPRL